MSETVERLAKAMASREGWRWDDDKQMLDCARAGLQNTSRERDSWRFRARTALDAFREPGIEIRHLTTFEFAEIEWPKLIDATLSKAGKT